MLALRDISPFSGFQCLCVCMWKCAGVLGASVWQMETAVWPLRDWLALLSPPDWVSNYRSLSARQTTLLYVISSRSHLARLLRWRCQILTAAVICKQHWRHWGLMNGTSLKVVKTLQAQVWLKMWISIMNGTEMKLGLLKYNTTKFKQSRESFVSITKTLHNHILPYISIYFSLFYFRQCTTHIFHQIL